MKQTIFISSISILLAVSMSCSSGQVGSNGSARPNADNAVASNSNQAVESNVAAVNINSSMPANAGELANKGKRIANSNSGPVPPLQFQKVDEDSDIATDMTKDGNLQQIRRFKNDRYITKAESVWLDANMKELTLYLRSGKTVKVRTDKLGDLKFASVGALLESAGVTASEQPDRPRVVDKKAPVQ